MLFVSHMDITHCCLQVIFGHAPYWRWTTEATCVTQTIETMYLSPRTTGSDIITKWCLWASLNPQHLCNHSLLLEPFKCPPREDVGWCCVQVGRRYGWWTPRDKSQRETNERKRGWVRAWALGEGRPCLQRKYNPPGGDLWDIGIAAVTK